MACGCKKRKIARLKFQKEQQKRSLLAFEKLKNKKIFL